MEKKNYHREMEQVLARLPESGSTLLLHSCCAPCSSYVLAYLRKFFRITVYYYNPNITEKNEYDKRAAEQERLIGQMNRERQQGEFEIGFVKGSYEPELFWEAARGLEQCPEGGERCEKCFRLRLENTACLADEGGFDFFTTSLTISPLKNAGLLNEIGNQAAGKTVFLPSDFKKKGGYQESVRLSIAYGLYRQDYCGCAFSKRDGASMESVMLQTGEN